MGFINGSNKPLSEDKTATSDGGRKAQSQTRPRIPIKTKTQQPWHSAGVSPKKRRAYGAPHKNGSPEHYKQTTSREPEGHPLISPWKRQYLWEPSYCSARSSKSWGRCFLKIYYLICLWKSYFSHPLYCIYDLPYQPYQPFHPVAYPGPP